MDIPKHDTYFFGTSELDGEYLLNVSARLGRCYELCARAIAFGDVPDGTVMVHGSIHGADAPRRIGHAWLELPDGLVWEPITAGIFTADEYTEWAKAEVEVRYSAWEATRKMIATQHFGRWHGSKHP